jgi:hypothetical protein
MSNSEPQKLADAVAALRCIQETCDEEIAARFAGHPEPIRIRSTVYQMLVLPRNIAANALKAIGL